MGLKSISIVLFGLALCCFLQGATAQEDACLLRLSYGPSYPNIFVWTWSQGGSFATPFKGWRDAYGYNSSNILETLGRVQKASSYCDYCTMTVFTRDNFTKDPQTIDFRTTVGDNSEIVLKRYSSSYILECFPPAPEPEEQEENWEPEEQEESQEEIEYEEAEEEEEEEEEDLNYANAVFQPMNEGDGETLPSWLVNWRQKTFQDAVNQLISKNLLPAGKYTRERVYSTEFATSSYYNFYRFNVKIRDESGAEYRIWWVTPAGDEIYVYEVIDAGYKENRTSEFTHTHFKVLSPELASARPYSPTVTDLFQRSVNQAIPRLQAKGILPQANYSFWNIYAVDYSSIINMTEYPDRDDTLYRFNMRILDQSGALWNVWTIIATNYETPEYYELIDYGYKQTRLAEFTNTEWKEMNEDTNLPLPDIVQTRNRSVAQAIPRLQAEGILPGGKFTITKTYATEFTFNFENPNWAYLSMTVEDALIRFNVQLSNEAGARFRVAIVIATNWNVEPNYELLDYFYVENRLDEFTNTKFVSLDQANLQTESINEAVDRLVAKDALPKGEYTIVKNYPTEFSPKFEHPDYSSDEYLLFQFTADVENAAKAEYKVYAIVIADYDNFQDFELIDYGRTQ